MANSSKTRLELTRSRLVMEKGVIIKSGSKGQVIGSHQLSDIRKLSMSKAFDQTGFSMLVVGAVLTVVAKFFIPWVILSSIASVLFAIIAVVGLLGLSKQMLDIETVHGIVRYDANDPSEDVQGFVVTVNNLLQDAQEPEPGENGEAAVL